MGTCFTTMVVKTDICNYSGFKIYPGHGKRFVRSDQRMLTFINGKSSACMLMKRRNLTTKWTVHYRRINKKGAAEESSRTKRKKATTTRTREISGLSQEMLEKRRSARPAAKGSKATDAALKELKSRKGAKKAPAKK